MATISTGQFPVSALDIKVKAGADNLVTIADLESAGITLDTNVETWYSITDDGWQNAMATAKAMTMDFSGKRTIGDTGNDYIAGLAFKNGQEVETDFEISFPNGDKLTFTGVVAVTDFLGGDATNVAPLSFTVTCKGKPTYTTA